MKKLLNNPVFKLIFGIFKTLFIIIVVLYLLFVLAQRFNGNGILGYRMFTVSSGSMEPTYKIFDVILVKETDPDDLVTGDVVTYLNSSETDSEITITHRIINITENDDGSLKFITRGDANDIDDQPITSDKILGKVIYKFKLYSLLTRLVNNKISFFFLIFVPLVVTIFLDVADTIMEREKIKELMQKQNNK